MADVVVKSFSKGRGKNLATAADKRVAALEAELAEANSCACATG